MAKKLVYRAAQWFLVPIDDSGAAFLAKRNGELVEGTYSQPRSLTQNSLLWAVARDVFPNLPAQWDGVWIDYEHMIDGLQVARGITYDVAVPTTKGGGFRLERHPSRISKMNADQANQAVSVLLETMSEMIGVSTSDLKERAYLEMGEPLATQPATS